MQPNVTMNPCDIWHAQTCTPAETEVDALAARFGGRRRTAVTCATRGRAALLTFYNSPVEHWDQRRTGNQFAGVLTFVRHRTVQTKDALTWKTEDLKVFKLRTAAKTWRRLVRVKQSHLAIDGVRSSDGVAANDGPDLATRSSGFSQYFAFFQPGLA